MMATLSVAKLFPKTIASQNLAATWYVIFMRIVVHKISWSTCPAQLLQTCTPLDKERAAVKQHLTQIQNQACSKPRMQDSHRPSCGRC